MLLLTLDTVSCTEDESTFSPISRCGNRKEVDALDRSTGQRHQSGELSDKTNGTYGHSIRSLQPRIQLPKQRSVF